MERWLLGLICLAFGCAEKVVPDYQLVVTNATIFNSTTLDLEKGQTVFIQDGVIVKIEEFKDSHKSFRNVLDAGSKLLTPSFMDVHNHLEFVLGDSIVTDSEEFEWARSKMSQAYMPHGITVVRSAGSRKAHVPMEREWMKTSPAYVDYYPTGGALVSLNTGFYNHAFVTDTSQVKLEIETNKNRGFKFVKVYSLMGKDELSTSIDVASKNNMTVFGHIEGNMVSMDEAMEVGLVNFEHVKTLFLEVLNSYESANGKLDGLPPDDDENWQIREYEIFNHFGANDSSLVKLVNRLKNKNATITPTLTIYANPLGLVESFTDVKLDSTNTFDWNEHKMDRAILGFNELASLTNKLYLNGVSLNTGSDTYEPGKVILSEMLLFHQAGIPMEDVLKIASLENARSMGIDTEYGSIEVGKKAQMILFDKSPLVEPVNLLSKKTVIKDGVIWLPTYNEQ
ncbi:MAG: hypothetical protein Tsb004_15670 [Allomuricauda sp.]